MLCSTTMAIFFCLRGGQENRELKLSMLERLNKPDRYLYRENSSKNRKGGVSEMRLEHKSVSSIANKDAGTRCHIYLLDLYISKLPNEAIEKDLFYCRPRSSIPPESLVWYSGVPVGKNNLGTMVSKMCQKAGISGKTNHSLRVTGTSVLFDAGVPEKIIQTRTGHRSLGGLRVYERVTDEQDEQVSKILSGSVEKFDNKVNKVATSVDTKAKEAVVTNSTSIPL